jgi:hypothetical protein
MATSGLFQGLNEAYDSYRSRQETMRQQDLQDEESEHTRLKRKQEQEDREYGLSRRPFEERTAELQQTGLEQDVEQGDYQKTLRSGQEEAERLQREQLEQSLEQSKAMHQEWLDNQESRKKLNTMAINKAKLDLDNANISYDMNKITLNAQQGAQKYRSWKNEFLSGGSMDDLVKKFNSDEDDTNNIKNVTGNDDGGWEVEFENGRVEKFANRDAVSEHLEFMSDPAFHQTYLLNQRKLANDLSIAAAKAAADAQTNLLPYKKDWQSNTVKGSDRFYGKIKQGLVDFGEPGAAGVAGAVRSLVDQIGALSGYQLVNSEVVDRVSRYADSMLLLDKVELRKRAKEIFEKMPDDQANFPPARFPNGKPDDDDPEYEIAMRELVFKDMDEQVNNLSQTVLRDYFAYNPDDGSARLRPGAGSKGTGDNKITTAGLERDKTSAASVADEKGLAPPLKRTKGKTQAPTQENPMTVSKFLITAIANMGNQGSAFKKETAGQEPRLNQKNRRKLEVAAEKAYDSTFPTLSTSQKQAWLDQYGKFLSKKTLAEAKKQAKKKVALR